MIAVDTNVLIYAHRRDASWQTARRLGPSELAEGPAAWALPWPCVHEFLAIVTHPRIFDPPTSLAAASDQVTAWLESPGITLLAEGPGYWDVLARVLSASKASGPRIHDARIAALCLHHGVRELWSADRDLSRFPGLSDRNPLVGT